MISAMNERVLLHVLVLDGDRGRRDACLKLALGDVIALHPAATIAEADALLATQPIDVALVDWQLGHRAPEGLAWIGRLRLHDPDCFRVVTTTLADPGAAIAAMNGGLIDAFLAWPWDDAQAVALIHQGAEACLLRRHNRELLQELSDRNRELLDFTDNLEHLVAERTASLQEANERLVHQQQTLVRLETQGVVSHLARGLAHELNNPLAVILGYTQRLQRSAADADTHRRLVTILDEVERCRGLVDQLRRLAAPLGEDTVDLNPATVLAAVLETRRAAGQPVPALRLHGAIPMVVAAPAALRRVFGEIVANAVIAGAQHLDLSGLIEHERVAVHLANDGAPLTEDEAAHATKPFFTTRAADGARGLGLAVAAGLLRDQHGHLEVLPAPNGGALAVIYLPCGEHSAASSTGADAATSSQPHGSVLVVDDDALVGELLGDVLHELGLRVQVVQTCAAARAMLASREPGDLLAVLADLHLPDGNGALLLDELERDPALAGRCALITGDALAPSSRPLLAKPFRVEDVGILLLRLLQQRT